MRVFPKLGAGGWGGVALGRSQARRVAPDTGWAQERMERRGALGSTHVGCAVNDIASAPSRGEGRARPGGAAVPRGGAMRCATGWWCLLSMAFAWARYWQGRSQARRDAPDPGWAQERMERRGVLESMDVGCAVKAIAKAPSRGEGRARPGGAAVPRGGAMVCATGRRCLLSMAYAWARFWRIRAERRGSRLTLGGRYGLGTTR